MNFMHGSGQLSRLLPQSRLFMAASIPVRSITDFTDYNKMVIPLQKLKFIKHPRYGRVYPVVSVDRRNEWPNFARFSTASLSLLNSLFLFSTFYMPIFTAEFSALIANPIVFIPSFISNYILY